MKKIQTALILVLGIVLISSCAKNDLTIIEGHILEYGTDKPIEGATVEIMREIIIDWQVSQHVIDEVLTDEDGYFYWETDENPMEDSYGIKRITSPQHFFYRCSNDINCGDIVEYLDKYEVVVHLDPIAYLQLHVEDVEELEGNYIRFGGTMFDNYSVELFGDSYEESFIVRGNRKELTRLNYTFEEGPNITKTDSLLVPAHDTLNYKLEY